jgi:class 3 adenylate cyclase
VRGALAIVRSAQAAGFSLRAGVHTGECERRGDDLAGLAVHIAARVAAHAGAQEVLVSRTVSDVVAGSGLVLQSRGEHALKGLDQRWELFAVQP